MNKVLGGLATIVLVAGLSVVGVQPASAASDYITVCNSSLSFTRISVRPTGGSLSQGWCAARQYNGDNRVRVNTDPTGASHSYIINPVGGPVGPCHTNSDNQSSDPPNYETVYYRNFDHGDCTN